MTSTEIPPTDATCGAADYGSEAASTWAANFLAALENRDAAALGALFTDGATFRELLSLSWQFRNGVGRDEIVSVLTDDATVAPTSLTIRAGATRAGEDSIEAFLDFTTADGAGEGYLVLHRAGDAWAAETVLLTLASLDEFPEAVDERRPVGRAHTPIIGRRAYLEELDVPCDENEPEVVIIGAGHNGLMTAARLKAIGIRALIIERNERVGDNWRNRYVGLALHTPLAADQLAYMPYPSTWTTFTPKDKLGDFLEAYATLLDLSVWTSTDIENVAQAEDGWTVEVTRADGTRRTLTPKHVVLATGMNGAPKDPSFPGQDTFAGEVLHAARYDGYKRHEGKRVVVVGSGVSGHDIAQDLAEHGVDVTMVQRGGTAVLDGHTFHKVMHAVHTGGQYTLAEGDLVNAAVPFGHLPAFGAAQLAQAAEMDKELLDGLKAAGFRLSDGPDGTGVLGLIFGANATGYYYNAGASDLIIDGTIKLAHGGVTSFTENAVVLEGDNALEADVVIFATGYEPPTASARAILGDEIADKVGQFADVADDREYGSLWRNCGIPGLWFMTSLSIEHGRFYSKHIALQIAAAKAGIISA